MTAVVPRLSALCRASPTLPARTAGAPRRPPVRPARHTGSGPPARTAGRGPAGRSPAGRARARRARGPAGRRWPARRPGAARHRAGTRRGQIAGGPQRVPEPVQRADLAGTRVAGDRVEYLLPADRVEV